MNRFKLTFIGSIISMAILLPDIFLDLDLFERYVRFLGSGDRYYLDEIALAVTILLFFVIFDVVRRIRKETLENEKLKIFKAMMASHNHIINNFLNQALLLRMTAEDTPGFDAEILDAYDECAKQAVDMIKAVGSITEISVDSILQTIHPKSPDDHV